MTDNTTASEGRPRIPRQVITPGTQTLKAGTDIPADPCNPLAFTSLQGGSDKTTIICI